jgi:HAMP domain-containing protein
MFKIIRHSLGLKISLLLTAITIPAVLLAAWLVIASESVAIEKMIVEKGKTAAITGASSYGAILDEGIRSGAITFDSLTNPKYEEYATPDKENKRYHSGFDAYTDRTVRGFEDACMESSTDIKYCVGNDINGYVSTTHTAFNNPPIGDPIKDRIESRQKRKFVTPMHVAATLNTLPFLVQTYHRDTGTEIFDISAPITIHDCEKGLFMNGRACTGEAAHYGSFRVGVIKDQIAAHRVILIRQLGIVFGFLTLSLLISTLFLVYRATRPLVQLAKIATEVSTFGDSNQEIVVKSDDEVGKISQAVKGLAKSVKLAMRRIGE